jgi:hypothetical protein
LSAVESKAGLLVVERTSGDDIKMRDLYMTVDDRPEQNVRFGKKLEISLAAGEHRIRVTNRLKYDEASFQIQAGETVRFEAVNVFIPGLMNAFAFIMGTAMYKPVLRRL